MKVSRVFFSLLLVATTALAQGPVAPVEVGAEAVKGFPLSMVGKLVFAQGKDWFQGSGTVVGARGVLTAAHNLWDAERGFSTELIFRRAFYGQPAGPDLQAGRVFVLGGYREKVRKLGATDLRTFGDDLGVLVFAGPVAGGSHAGWWANAPVLAGREPGLALGYGAEAHSGEVLLGVRPALGYERVVESFLANRSVTFEGGMSGGPVLVKGPAGGLTVAGVVVAGAVDATSGGIRMLDERAAAFLRAYLP